MAVAPCRAGRGLEARCGGSAHRIGAGFCDAVRRARSRQAPCPGVMAVAQPLDFGVEYLQERIDREIVLAKHMGIIVEAAHAGALVLRAPLAPNANHKGTAFGGSLYSVAVLTGWAWVTRYLAARGLAADAVIQESSVRFLSPVQGELRACTAAPPEAQIDKF